VGESILQARPALENFEFVAGELRLAERCDLALLSIAISDEDLLAVTEDLEKRVGMRLPNIGYSTTTDQPGRRLMGLQPGLWLLLHEHPGGDPVQALHEQSGKPLNPLARITDQSDAWVFLELHGANSIAALERLCPLDLHPEHFQVDQLARTVFELMGVILIRQQIDSWLLLSARSTASSFAHALSTAVDSIS